MTYGPGFVGSPNKTACSFVPASLRTNLISAGATKLTALRSMSLVETAGTATITIPRAAVKRRVRPFMVRPSFECDSRLMVGLSAARIERQPRRSLSRRWLYREVDNRIGQKVTPAFHRIVLLVLEHDESGIREALVQSADGLLG